MKKLRLKFGNLMVENTTGRVFMASGEEYPYFQKFNRDGQSDGYLYVRVRGQTRAVHRLVAQLFLPKPREDFKVVDHINRVRSDNRASNLRWVNPWLNSINRDNINTTKWDADVNMWYGSFWVKGKETIVGWFSTFLDSHLAVRKAKEKAFQQIYDGLVKKNQQ